MVVAFVPNNEVFVIFEFHIYLVAKIPIIASLSLVIKDTRAYFGL